MSLEAALAQELTSLQRVVVAFSGGVDSATLAYGALKVLGPDRVLAVTADSDSLATGEMEHCARLANEWDMPWRSVSTNEMANATYVANSGDRCYWCKNALMEALVPVADEMDAAITLGVNVDDLGDHRPGQEAAREHGARFPLVDAGLAKADVRNLSKSWGLEVWDRPAMPCLSSRVPYGTPVTIKVLSRIDRAEQALRDLGFDDLRVRHYGDTARIEVPASRMSEVVAQSEAVVAAMHRSGYEYATLDLAGLRSGNLNAALDNRVS